MPDVTGVHYIFVGFPDGECQKRRWIVEVGTHIDRYKILQRFAHFEALNV